MGVFKECNNCLVIRLQIQVFTATGKPEKEIDRHSVGLAWLNLLPGTATTKALR